MMNETVKNILNHRSIRKYKDREVSEEVSMYRREIEEFERHPELNESVFFVMKKIG